MLDADWVTPLLAIGAAPSPPDVEALGVGALALCAEEFQPHSSDYLIDLILHAPFSDTEQPTLKDVSVASVAGVWVAQRIRDRVPTLVSCWAGRNRSGLVCVFALRRAYGLSGPAALHLVRERRLGALTNDSFAALGAFGKVGS